MGKATERLTLATPRIPDLQYATSNSPDLRWILDETTITTTTVPAVGPMPPLFHHELQNTPVKALQLVEFLYTKMADWNEDLKKKAAPLENSTHEARTTLAEKEEHQGSALKRD